MAWKHEDLQRLQRQWAREDAETLRRRAQEAGVPLVTSVQASGRRLGLGFSAAQVLKQEDVDAWLRDLKDAVHDVSTDIVIDSIQLPTPQPGQEFFVVNATASVPTRDEIKGLLELYGPLAAVFAPMLPSDADEMEALIQQVRRELEEVRKSEAGPPAYPQGFRIEPRAKPEGCPKCGHRGDFVRMALCCPEHGPFGGI